MANANLPSRKTIIEGLRSEKGNGKGAMLGRLDILRERYPEATDEEWNRIIDDLDSYSEWLEELEG